MNQYTVLTRLGEGAFSVVYKVKRKEDGKEYAMKKMRIMNLSEKQLANCLNEVRILASIQHPNILSYKDSFYDQLSSTFCIITELLEGGDVFQMIQKHKLSKKLISEQTIWRVAHQTLKGLSTLHSMNILHRDIKSANIFFNKNYNSIKLADLNVSIVTANGMAKTQTGTPYYASPEVWMQKSYSSKCDIWSLGCVLYEMATLRPPFVSQDLKSLKRTIICGTYKKLSAPYSSNLDNFIKLCLNVDPKLRFSADALLESEYLKSRNSNEMIQNDSIGIINQSSHRLLQKIVLPKKREFRSIKQKLPKHRFETEVTEGKISQNKSFCISKNKQNLNNTNNGMTKNEVLPLIKRSNSTNNNKQPRQLIHLLQQKILGRQQRPPLPKKPIRA